MSIVGRLEEQQAATPMSAAASAAAAAAAAAAAQHNEAPTPAGTATDEVHKESSDGTNGDSSNGKSGGDVGEGAASEQDPVLSVTTAATPGEMLHNPMFYLLWLIFFIGAGAGLMVISSVSGMAKKSMGASAFIAVAIMAIGNAGGRIIAGILSDKIGRRWTLMLVLFVQSALMFLAIPLTASKETTPLLIVLLATFIGFNYGANLSLFPSLAKDFWGLKSFGVNYGILFTAWGVGGFVLSRLQQMLTVAAHGSYQTSFTVAGAFLLGGAALALFVKPPVKNS
jgi:nitrate/nitrite transporter NarK